MSRPTVSSTVSHGNLNRRVRQPQPLSPVTSTVRPTVASTVSHGSAYRSLSYSGSLEPFQGSLSQAVTQSATQASRRLTPLTSERYGCAVEDKNKNSRGLTA